jgi:hypothetical protein
MTTYDPREMTWDQYCKLMQELFGPQELGNVPEENWRDWVDGMNGIGYFVNSAIPDQRMFDTWQSWAENMVGIMNIAA